MCCQLQHCYFHSEHRAIRAVSVNIGQQLQNNQCHLAFERNSFHINRSIKEVVSAYDVPDDLIKHLPDPFPVLISKYMMDKTNEKFVPIGDSADDHQIEHS